MLLWLLLLTFALWMFYNYYWKRRGLPPGPPPFPVIGNLWELILNPPGESVHRKWRDKYGAVFTYWQGELPIVAITTYEKIVDTVQRDADTYTGRLAMEEFTKLFKGGQYGVIMTEGDRWRDQRRFALHVLRDFGLGKSLMQEKILDEVAAMIAGIEKDLSSGVEDIHVDDHVDLAVGSIINSLVFGYPFRGAHEEEFHKLKKLVTDLFQSFGTPLIMILVMRPQLFRHLPLFKGAFDTLMARKNELYAWLRSKIEEHQREIDFSQEVEPKDYVEAFLREKFRRDKGEARHYFSVDQLENMCFDLWAAGQETTSHTLAWGLAYLVHYPLVQARMHDELDRVIGSNRLIDMSDRSQLPYANAVVMETQRIANLLPTIIQRRTTKDTEIDGYKLAKGTLVVPQISVILYDEKFFPNPKAFNPDRFIDEDGQLKRCEQLIPFSVGKRQCLGESLARMELFLFVANTNLRQSDAEHH